MEYQSTGHCSNHQIQYGRGITYPPFPRHELHAHETCELFYLIRGNGYYITEGARHKLEPGLLILMRSGETHMPSVTGEEPYERIALHFSPTLVDGIDPRHRILAPFFDRPLGQHNVYDRSALASTGIYEAFADMNHSSGDNYDNCLHVTTLLLYVLNELNTLFHAERYQRTTADADHLHSLLEYLNEHITSPLSIDYLCEKFYISRAQLNRSFKNITGTTVWDYIITKRLMLARSYLAEGMHANEAASASGFGDYSAFYRAYRRQYGTTPSEKPC